MRSLLCMLLLLPLLAACGDVRQTVGLGRNNPDEFTVVKNPPLAMPVRNLRLSLPRARWAPPFKPMRRLARDWQRS